MWASIRFQSRGGPSPRCSPREFGKEEFLGSGGVTSRVVGDRGRFYGTDYQSSQIKSADKPQRANAPQSLSSRVLTAHSCCCAHLQKYRNLQDSSGHGSLAYGQTNWASRPKRMAVQCRRLAVEIWLRLSTKSPLTATQLSR